MILDEVDRNLEANHGIPAERLRRRRELMNGAVRD